MMAPLGGASHIIALHSPDRTVQGAFTLFDITNAASLQLVLYQELSRGISGIFL